MERAFFTLGFLYGENANLRFLLIPITHEIAPEVINFAGSFLSLEAALSIDKPA